MLKSLILFLLFSIQQVFALESTDVMDTQILKAYDYNVLVLNRGLEDGIHRNDHIKLTNDNGFIARGICIKTSLLVSHFRVYRVSRPELVSKDAIYQLRSINQSKIPRDIAKLKRVDFSPYFNTYNDEKMLKQVKLQDNRIVKYDLPTEVRRSEIFEQRKQTKFDEFISENFDDEELKRDLSNTYFEVFFSPYTLESLYDQKQSHYGARIYNFGQKYRYSLQAIERQRKIVDPLNESNKYETKSTGYQLDFQINRVTENISLVSSARYDREKFGRIYYPHKWLRIAPIGFRYHFWEEDPKDNFFDISYAPTVDIMEYNDLSNPYTDSLFERQGYRHTFIMRLHSDVTENLSTKFNLYYAPFSENPYGSTDWGDNMFDMSNTFSYKMDGGFFMDFTFQYMTDELRAKTYDIKEVNSINSLRLRYEVAL